MRSRSVPFGCALVIGLLAVGCGQHPRAQVPAAAPPPVATAPAAAPAPLPPPDPVATLLAASDHHFTNGEQQLRLGHLVQARTQFNRALEVILESPYGARSDDRIREHYERLVDRISAYEAAALAAGDGFAEKPSDPASIDELLATSAFVVPAPQPALDAIKGTVEADLAQATHDIEIPLNNRVLAYVELFQGRLRDFVAAGLQRGTRYLPMIQQVFRAEGLPLDLAYVPLIESAFKPTAVSRAQAKGVWQFMKGTALENGLKHDWYIDERADPEKATRAAAKYLRTLSRMFDGDWHLALASYNGGPGLVQRAMRRSGAADFWQLSSGKTRYLPRETREYVPMILAAIIVARNPAQYGFDVTPEPLLPVETIAVGRPVDLRRVAEWTGSSIDDIQALNPELRRWTTPLRASTYELKVPQGTAEVLKQKLDAAPPTDFTAFKWHTVKRGESIATLARRFGVSRADLAGANSLSVKSKLRQGQEVLIPRAPTPLLSPRVSGAMAARATTTGEADAVRTSYRVKRGDTLSSIARRFGVTVEDLKAWNRLRSSRLMPGTSLAINRTASAQNTQ